jgi:3'-phosphoadenosine 5'-phosphosulfate sulfotransferase (PAPS reductase)/FAD synthetase
VDRLDELEAQSIFILREAVNRLQPLAMLWSIGKDSNALLWLARNVRAISCCAPTARRWRAGLPRCASIRTSAVR